MQNSYLTLLRNRPQVRRLWLAQVVSLTGDWFGTIAAIILVNRYTDSGLVISILFLARGLPSFLLAPIVGVVADRFNRKHVLVITDVMQTAVGLAFLLILQFESVALLYLLTLLQWTLAAFFEPARAAILPNLVETDDELVIANTLASTTWSAMLSIGAVIGGLTTAIFGVGAAIIINAFTFMGSAYMMSRIHVEEKTVTEHDTPQSGYFAFVDGLRYVLQRPIIGIYASVKGLSQVGSVDTLFTLYAASVFVIGSEGSITLAVLFMSFGIGAILGPVIGNRFSDNSDRFFRRWIAIGFACVSVGWGVFGVAPTLFVAALAIVVRGMASSLNWTYSSVQLQRKVPDQYMGRVFSLDFSVFTLAYTIAVLLTGLLDDVADLEPRTIAYVFAVMGLVPMLIWYRAMYYLRRQENPVVGAEATV